MRAMQLDVKQDSCEGNTLHSLLPLDPQWVAQQLSSPPFVDIEGVTNVRSLGDYQTCIPGITEKGAGSSVVNRKAQLKELNITTVFDLRSDTEIAKYNTPVPEIEGVEVQRVPVFKTEDYSPEVMARRYQLYASAKTEAFMELYTQMMDSGGPAFAEILRHVRDRPNEGLLIHCTAGKDRTAVIAAILLSIAGVSDEDIARDYELTRVGREPVRDRIMKRLAQEPIFASNKEAALNMLTSRRETMLAFLQLLRTKYGGAENYVQQYCGLSPEDVETIRRNLLVSQQDSPQST